MAFVFQASSPNAQIWVFLVNKYQLSYHNKILPVPYIKDTDFKADIGFWKFWAQMPKFGDFGPKSINLLILIKLCLYPILKVLMSNLTLVFQNFGIS